ncbi:MAG: FAD-dependent oxidoreductase [Bacteroidota bacterium]
MSSASQISRRTVLKRASALVIAPVATKQEKWPTINYNYGSKPSTVVVGAGAFGGWTALYLLRQGYDVTLCDTWGPGNARASSGGETRLARCMYGDKQVYFDLARRALTLWKEHQAQFSQPVFYSTGLLVFCQMEHYDYAEQARSLYQEAQMPLEWLSPDEIQQYFPLVRTDDLNHAVYDPSAGFVLARQACTEVVNQFTREGGKFRQAHALPNETRNGKLASVRLSDNSTLTADCYVFAGGPWLGQAFPELLQNKLRVTRQPVFMFGLPPQFSTTLAQRPLPTWMNRDLANQERHYGVPSSDYRGFKIGWAPPNTELFDPTHNDRLVRPEEVEQARTLLTHRFPFMKDAPLLESRVCQHTDTFDKHFITDRHPDLANTWILGGGSGHAFKHAPALGELASQLITDEQEVPALFSFSRFSTAEGFTQQHH